jgi:NADH dehydrogenase [ubiquinone] 1 alpha subcomplex assembly factor 5
LHNINDLAGFIIQSAMSLRPDGLFLANFIAGDSLQELREVLAIAESEITGGLSVHISPMVEIRAAGMLLQRAGLALPVVDSEEIKLSYENIFALMKDIKAMGENLYLHKRAKNFMRKDVLIRAGELYQEKYGDEEGRIIATIEIITMSAWKLSPNQQKPLAKGSAKNKLQDFL